jgi:hypothetical protein
MYTYKENTSVLISVVQLIPVHKDKKREMQFPYVLSCTFIHLPFNSSSTHAGGMLLTDEPDDMEILNRKREMSYLRFSWQSVLRLQEEEHFPEDVGSRLLQVSNYLLKYSSFLKVCSNRMAPNHEITPETLQVVRRATVKLYTNDNLW